ncbi:GNAT family N-acetyltransferase [Psychrobacillus vulpis]|uniref:GNAT family N-acetyltransferase n=1 Tax=Psychrobacillus vulpis TaxID=2325572 RepID=A0A544TVP2_9BACI|nr:GNAT family N-acetyltransferase [Psychrobacillus vulpis]TQR21517.1 GNAT family N-acetyltransferase [Psychrobacillus vulpis]
MPKLSESKYIPLATFFKQSTQRELSLTYDEIEAIIGQVLPNAAYLSSSWWKKTKPPALHFFAWTDHGYSVKSVNLGKSVLFHNVVHEKDERLLDENNKQDILIIREAELEDARSFISLQESIFSETDFMLYGKSDIQMTVQAVRKEMNFWKNSTNSILLLAIMNGQFAGYVLFTGGPAPRALHRATVVIGVKQMFSKKGIASSLMLHGEKWAKEVGISKLELTVIKENLNAQKLYEKLGFENEGTRKNALIINEEFVDEFFMGKLI